MIMPADRLTTLEIRAAEQEKTIEELSGQIAEQWKAIERLQKKLDALTDASWRWRSRRRRRSRRPSRRIGEASMRRTSA